LEFPQLMRCLVHDHLLLPPHFQSVEVFPPVEGLDPINLENLDEGAFVVVVLDVSAVPSGELKGELSLGGVDLLAKNIELNKRE
jgi:hypothetical protein